MRPFFGWEARERAGSGSGGGLDALGVKRGGGGVTPARVSDSEEREKETRDNLRPAGRRIARAARGQFTDL